MDSSSILFKQSRSLIAGNALSKRSLWISSALLDRLAHPTLNGAKCQDYNLAPWFMGRMLRCNKLAANRT